jgi:hypothetical protein
MEIKRSGSEPSYKGPPKYFTGTVRVDPLFVTRPVLVALLSPSSPARARRGIRIR